MTVEKSAKFVFDANNVPAGRTARFEFDQHVDVTIRSKFFSKNLAEQPQALDVIHAAKLGDPLRVDGDLVRCRV